MDSQITQLLESTNPQDRKKAITLLTNMGGQEALRALAGIYKYDEDSVLRELALQAGKHIKKQEMLATAEIPWIPPTKDYRSTMTDEDEIRPVVVTAGRQAEAQRFLDRASEESIKGEHIKALDNLVKAFKANPNYRLDADAISTARNITGLDKADFVDALDDEWRMRRLVKEITTKGVKKKNKGKDTADGKDENGDPLWSTTLIDLAFYYVILTAIAVITIVIAAKTYQTAATIVEQGCQGCTAVELVRLRDLVQQTKSVFVFTPIQGILFGLIWSLTTLLQLVVYYGILHSMVHMFLSTEGGFRGMLHYCAKFDIILYSITLGLLSVIGLLMLRDLYDPNYYTLYTEGGGPLWKPLWSIVAVVVFVGGLWSLRRVIKFYRVGCFQVGCVILISSTISSMILGGLTSGVVDKFFASALKALMK